MNKTNVTEIIKKMLVTPDMITSVKSSSDFEDGEEFYFNYPENKYFWSIAKDNAGEFYLFYYPSAESKDDFLRFEGQDLSSEAKDGLKTLFDTVQEKNFGFDDVVKEILKKKG